MKVAQRHLMKMGIWCMTTMLMSMEISMMIRLLLLIRVLRTVAALALPCMVHRAPMVVNSVVVQQAMPSHLVTPPHLTQSLP
jgi:hypothetical protein